MSSRNSRVSRSKHRTIGAIVVLLVLAACLLAGWGLVMSGVIGGAARYGEVAYAAEIVPLPHNQLLITDFGFLDRTRGQVIITDDRDHLLWKYHGRLVNPHSAYPAKGGNILISDTGDNRVIEVNRSSRIVWDTDDLGGGDGRLGQGRMSDGSRLDYPNDAKLLPDGTIMISCRLQNRVIRITRTGRIVWKVGGFLNRQHNPDMLPNGNVIIADSGWNRVIEVNPRGKIVWRFGSPRTHQLAWPRDANVLHNGNVLITDSDHNRIIEVNRSGQIVRQWTGLQRPYSTASLPDGDILVGDGLGPGVVRLNGKDQIVWKLNRNLKAYLSGIPWRVKNGGFEMARKGSRNLLADWTRDDALAYSLQPPTRVTMVRDGSVHHGGRYSGRITYSGDSNGVYLGQRVRVQPGHTYEFSGWIRTKDVRACSPCVYGPGAPPGQTAEYELTLDPNQGAYPPSPALPQHSGTTPWTRDSVTFSIPANVHVVEINGFLRGRGTVWFDDVSLRRTA